MLKLFYSPGACSLVSHIALEEAGADYEAARLNLAEGDQRRQDYLAINPHARVPALVTDQGTITENVAIVNYLADRFRSDGSVPRTDAFTTANCNELLGWFASSVHIAFAEVFRPGRFVTDDALHDAVRQGGRAALEGYFNEIDARCGDGWITGEQFSAADSYLAVFFRWMRWLQIDRSRYPRWAALVGRVVERTAVQRALAGEDLQVSEFLIS